jgi:hypothetical protein
MGAELSPEYWRARAAQTRALADAMQRPDARAMMMKIVDDYERMARVAEEMRKRAQLRSA